MEIILLWKSELIFFYQSSISLAIEKSDATLISDHFGGVYVSLPGG